MPTRDGASNVSRIVVLGSGPLCRHPRLHKEATALGAAGHDVTVLTVAYNAAEEAKDAELLSRAPYRKVVVDLVAGPDPVSKARRFAHRLSRLVSQRLVSTGLLGAHSLGPASALARRARALTWDLLIAHTELPMVIASRLLAEGRPIAVDFEDWHSRDLLEADSVHRPIELLRETEGMLMRRALCVTTTSEAMAEGLHAAYGGRRPVAVRNVFPLQPGPLPDRPLSPPSLFWFSQTVGPGRGLEGFIGAWNLTRRPSRLALLGHFVPGYQEALLSLCLPEKRPSLSFLSTVPPRDLPRVIAAHDIGLALEPLEPDNKNLTISNKIFHYLDAGLCVLATATAGQREVAARAPAACQTIELTRTENLAAELDALLASPERIRSMGAAARLAAETEFCWEREAPRLVAAVEAGLAKGAAMRPGSP